MAFRQSLMCSSRTLFASRRVLLNLGASSARCLATKAEGTEAAAPKTPKKNTTPAKVKLDKSAFPPKKPLSTFAKFITLHSDMVIGGSKAPFSALRERWGTLSDAEKKKYSSTKQEWDEYYAAAEEWRDNVDPVTLKELNRRRKARGISTKLKTNKRPPNSYALFYSAMYPKVFVELQDSDPSSLEGRGRVTAVSLAVAEAWKNTPDSEKQIWKQKAEALREEYNKKLKEKADGHATAD